MIRIRQQIYNLYRKIHLFLKKTPNFERFEKYYFSRILRQFCYDLVQKFHVQKREQTCRCGVNAIGKHRVKKCSIWEEDFAFIF